MKIKAAMNKPAIILLSVTVVLAVIVVGVVFVIKNQEAKTAPDELLTEPSSKTYTKDVPLGEPTQGALPGQALPSSSETPGVPTPTDFLESLDALTALQEQGEAGSATGESTLQEVTPTPEEIILVGEGTLTTTPTPVSTTLPKSGLPPYTLFFVVLVSVGLIGLAFVL